MDSPFPRKTHDHQVCINDALDDAETLCKTRSARLTPLRRRVLEIVWRQHAPTGAYDILKVLRTSNKKAEPPTVYRALDFLMENGLVHRIQSLNAYVGCRCPGEQHEGMFLICRSCGIAGEIPSKSVKKAISDVAGKSGFSLSGINLEALGECPECRSHGAGGNHHG